MDNKKAEEYYLKAYENGNYESLCGLAHMYFDMNLIPYASIYRVTDSIERKKFFESQDSKKMKGYTEEEVKEKMEMTKSELRKVKHNCDFLDF